MNWVRQISANPGLRTRLLVTLGALAVYRIADWAPVPTPALDSVPQGYSALAVGLYPYAVVCVLIQIVGVFRRPFAGPAAGTSEWHLRLGRLARRLALLLAGVQALSFGFTLQNQGFVAEPGVGFLAGTALTLTAGTALCILLADMVTMHGFGNGIILLWATDSALQMSGLFHEFGAAWGWLGMVANPSVDPIDAEFWQGRWMMLGVATVAAVLLILWMEHAKREAPVAFGQRGSTVRAQLRLPLSASGLIPAAITTSLLAFPQVVLQLQEDPDAHPVLQAFSFGEPLYVLGSVAICVACSMAYVRTTIRHKQLVSELNACGGWIDGANGEPAEDRLRVTLNRIALFNGLYLSVVMLFGDILIAGIRIHHWPGIGDWADRTLPAWFLNGLGFDFYVPGVTILFLVRVALDLTARFRVECAAAEAGETGQPAISTSTVSSERFCGLARLRYLGSTPETLVASARLRAAGIRFLMENEYLQDLEAWGRVGLGFNVFAGAPVLWVEQERFEEAEALLGGRNAVVPQ